MDAKRFDDFVHSFASEPSRRGLLAGLASGLLALHVRSEGVEARKKRKKRKKKPVLCEGRVCGPNSLGTGSCGDCGSCKSCEGGACVAKLNGVACGGSGGCVEGTCCPSIDRVCGTLCCPTGTNCVDSENQRCAPNCDIACDDRAPQCNCQVAFNTDRSYCSVKPVGNVCDLPECDSQSDCAPTAVCAKTTCGAGDTPRCIETCA